MSRWEKFCDEHVAPWIALFFCIGIFFSIAFPFAQAIGNAVCDQQCKQQARQTAVANFDRDYTVTGRFE